jgi:hypothetical protein
MTREKSGFKVLVDGFFENSLAASNYMKTIVQNLTLVALETKKLADALLRMNDRLDRHEILIADLYDLKSDDSGGPSLDLPKTNKQSSKPN